MFLQLIVAEVLTVIYALVMIVVLVGMLLQVAADGFLAPNALLFLIVIGQFVTAALLHPQELSCLPSGFIYYITVPSMYMLLIIFSIFNVHNITWGTRESKLQGQAQVCEGLLTFGFVNFLYMFLVTIFCLGIRQKIIT